MNKERQRVRVQGGRAAWAALIIGLCLINGSYAIEAQTGPGGGAVSVSGKVASFKGHDVIIETNSGPVAVKLADKIIIRGEVPIKFSDITPGMYVGATAERQPDATFRASRLHVFSEDQRGTGEGHGPLRSAPQSGLTMTNANVENVEDVAVENVKGRMLTLKYKGGEIKVWVPPDTRVVRRVIGDRTLLKPGAVVSTQAMRAADGSLSASQITIRASEG
jgi:hypothetical protein